MFVYEYKGKRIVGGALMANSTQIDLATLHALARAQVITYEEEPVGSRCFGVKMWEVKLTAIGRAYLEQQIAQVSP